MNKKLVIIFIIFIFLAITGGVFWWWQGEKKEREIPAELPEGIKYATPETGAIEGVIKPAPFNLEDVVVDPETGTQIIKNEIIILFEDDVSEEERNEIITSINGEIVGYRLGGQDVDVKIKNNPSIEDLKGIVKELNQNPKIIDAGLSTVGTLRPMKVPDQKKDPQWKDSWNEKSPKGKNWGLEAIYAPSAWDNNNLIEPIRIGVVDVGFKIEHEDLKIPEISARFEHKYSIKEIMSMIEEINKGRKKECRIGNKGAINHGTHIAGIIGALSNNEVGITGIVWNRDLFAYQVDLKDINLLGGVEWLLNQNTKIINLSWGLDYKCNSQEEIKNAQERYNNRLKELIKKYNNFLIVQSAGNSGIEAEREVIFNPQLDKLKYKELKKQVITVGAIENKGKDRYQITDFSNYGGLVDIIAPGKEIYGTFWKEDEGIPWWKFWEREAPFTVCFDLFNSKYGCMQGTSMAAPFVTGVAGLVWGANPDLTAEQVKETIVNSADRPIKHKEREYKILNAKNAVESTLANQEKPKTFGALIDEQQDNGAKKEPIEYPDVSIFYQSNDQIWQYNPRTDLKTKIADGNGLSLSPDKNTLAFSRKETPEVPGEYSTNLLNLNTGQTRECPPDERLWETDGGPESWSPDSKYFIVDYGTYIIRGKSIVDSINCKTIADFSVCGNYEWINNKEIIFGNYNDETECFAKGISILNIETGKQTNLLKPIPTKDYDFIRQLENGKLYLKLTEVASFEDWYPNNPDKQKTTWTIDKDGENLTQVDSKEFEEIKSKYQEQEELAQKIKNLLPASYKDYILFPYSINPLNREGKNWLIFVLNKEGRTAATDEIFIINLDNPQTFKRIDKGDSPDW